MKLRQLAVMAVLVCVAAAARAREPMIVGYFPFWATFGHNATLADAPVERLTHLVYDFAELKSDGSVVPGNFFADLVRIHQTDNNTLYRGNFGVLPLLRERNPRLKVLISIGGWIWSRNLSDVSADPDKRQRLVTTLLAFMDRYGFDGVELDWRYPVVGGAPQTGKRPDDLVHMQQLLDEVHAACKARPKGCLIALAVNPEPSTHAGWDFPALTRHVDMVTLMAMDFRGSWSKSTGHKSPLYSDPANPAPSIASAIEDLKRAGAPMAKVVTVLPAQGISWLGVAPREHGLHQAHKGAPFGTWDNESTGPTGTFAYSEITRFAANGEFEPYWDDAAKADTLYQPKTGQFISFESPRSLTAKLDFIDQQQLGGVGFWETSSDAPGEAALLAQAYRHYHPWAGGWLALKQHWRTALPWLVGVAGGLLLALLFGMWRWRGRQRQQWAVEVAQHQAVVSLLTILPPQLLTATRQAALARQRWADRLDVIEVAQLDALAEDCFTMHQQLLPLAEVLAPVTEPVALQTARDALLDLERFSRRIASERSLEKMLDAMVSFLAEDSRVREATLLDEDSADEELEGADGLLTLAPNRSKAIVRHAALADYRVALQFHTPLTDDEEIYFRSLANQVVLIRQQLRELARQPQLLAELYEVASRRDKLHFIRAEKGYSGIFAADLESPHYITLRLRALRLYFGELVQVHRSYLVRPQAVTGSRRAASGGIELLVAGKAVPVARTCLARLKADYPAWFEQEKQRAAA
ncbi:glycosyl hydrolase family 18 protein [Andreprevotia chitinilytica]|uniref:glycosyl hydrolase family 18 protein n=1 Tax=Andreprevotia chitinilytica TaxID=396808 RepID=UPI0005569F78|nr:glycosyl hydrolase family 18 protein [Andreprevotia chitinilytica]